MVISNIQVNSIPMPAQKIIPVSSYLLRVSLLVVDPNPFMRSIICSVLRLFGAHKIHEAADGSTASDEMKLFAPELIITEYAMAPVSGVKFVQGIRTGKISNNPTVPIIMATAYSEVKNVVAARDAGVNDFLFKPLSAHSLMKHVLNVVEKPRPFVQADTYFGPDRRRAQKPLPGPERRIQAPTDPD
jgi:two-component system, chemotaxis family, chemotaxis protein CheY